MPLEELSGIVVGNSMPTALNLVDNDYMCEEWGLPPKQVLIAGDGHWWISLDHRKGPTPSVAWIDVEGEEELLLAATFAEVIDKQVPASDFDVEQK